MDRVGPVIFVEHVLTPEAGPPAPSGRGDARAEIDQRAGVDLVILALHRGHGEHADRLALAVDADAGIAVARPGSRELPIRADRELPFGGIGKPRSEERRVGEEGVGTRDTGCPWAT